MPLLTCAVLRGLLALIALLTASPIVDSLTRSFGGPVLVATAWADDDDDDDGPIFVPRRIAPPSYARPRRDVRRAPARRAVARARPIAAAPVAGREIVVAGIDAAGLDRLRAEGFALTSRRGLSLTPGLLARVRPPRSLPITRAIARIRAIAPGAAVDRNHLYRIVYRVQGSPAARGAFTDPPAAVAWPRDRASCRPARPIGLIDTGIVAEHPALAGRSLIRETVRASDRAPSSTDHGTALATLLLADTGSMGLLPSAEVIAVDAFHRRDGRDQADAADLVAGLDLLVGRGAGTVNLSLAGPANEVLDRAGRAARDRGVIVVAASGNAGPTSPPLFPAAYPWALAVTALDERRAVYSRAVRGTHLDLAAPGVALSLPDARGRARLHSGTSFAAPFVTAALALARRDGQTPDEAVQALIGAAVDLGPAGVDPTFGAGLLQVTARCSP